MDIRISQYILESGIGLLVFYGTYYCLLRKETFFQSNRIYLLATALLSVIIPLMHYSWPAPESMSSPAPVAQKFAEPQPESPEVFLAPSFVQEWHEAELHI